VILKRGDIWTISGGADYAGKPRLAVIVQDGSFAELDSVTLILVTSDLTDLPQFRPHLEPTPGNGLREPSKLMIDKISTIPRSKLGSRIGRLKDADMASVNRAIMVFLGLTSSRARI
jgi:mRNA interferase MazF